ncbi:MAG: dTMP kinase [Ilumatobacter sp.]|nr:dTMP kinase [Ilumatobacter sp.]
MSDPSALRSVPSGTVNRPVYIALEGAEGCGKSTQAALLAERLGAVLTRETGGTPVGARLRQILHDNDVDDLAPRAEALIAAADRAQHIHQVVKPALDAGRSVVSDRSVYSSLAYQGYGRQLDVDEVRKLNRWATGEVWPDVVILLEADDDIVAERMSARDLDRFEAAGDEFHQRVIDGFRALAADEPERWITVAATGTIADVAAAIDDALRERESR